MRHKIIPSVQSIVIILACAALAGSFIFLSTRQLNKEVQLASQSIDIENMYNIWEEKPEYKVKQIDVSFQYDTRQVDDVHVVSYEITNEVGVENITQTEIDVLLDCYRNQVCDDVDISEKTEHLIKNYKNFIIKDDIVVVYGLYPVDSVESFGEVDNNVFVIKEDLFAKIVNPIYSKTNNKYDKIRQNFLMNNVNIEYQDYTNEIRIAKKTEIIEEEIVDILEEKAVYVKDDITLLKVIADSVFIVENEEI